MPKPQSDLAIETLKNPYNFDFLNLGDEALERDVEQAMINHIENVLLELGQGFALVGRQYKITVDDDDYFTRTSARTWTSFSGARAKPKTCTTPPAG